MLSFIWHWKDQVLTLATELHSFVLMDKLESSCPWQELPLIWLSLKPTHFIKVSLNGGGLNAALDLHCGPVSMIFSCWKTSHHFTPLASISRGSCQAVDIGHARSPGPACRSTTESVYFTAFCCILFQFRKKKDLASNKKHFFVGFFFHYFFSHTSIMRQHDLWDGPL